MIKVRIKPVVYPLFTKLGCPAPGDGGRWAKKLWTIAVRKLDQLDSVLSLDELRVPPGNRLEALSKDRKGQHSIRINDQYRICFRWTDTGPINVEITDYH